MTSPLPDPLPARPRYRLTTLTGLLAMALALSLAAGQASAAEQRPEPGPQPSGTRPLPSLANPASKNCGDVGGTLDIVRSAQGEIGICHFPDGSSCEEWALLRGECAPGEKPTDGNGAKSPGHE